MIRLLARLVLNVLANAAGLIVAAVILDAFSIHGLSFAIAVAIFSLATTVLGPLILKIALSNAPYLVGGISLVTTFVGLFITNLVSSGISIRGLSTWVMAPMIVWAFSLIASILLPLVIFKKALGASRSKTDTPSRPVVNV